MTSFHIKQESWDNFQSILNQNSKVITTTSILTPKFSNLSLLTQIKMEKGAKKV